jgi:sulfatase maturation enzyme AslB (radical SAM superfamily)
MSEIILTRNKLILRNEPFGGVYFDQFNGRTVMVDQEAFLTFLKYLEKQNLNLKEKEFIKVFFNHKTPRKINLRLKKSIQFEKRALLITDTPVLIDLSLNNYCNLHCPYCYMSATSLEHGSNLSMDDFELLLRDMIKSRVLQIALGGGEPTLHPNFTEILCKLRVEGDIIPNYTTNGSNLTHEILKASKDYCGAVAVSYSEERENETI